MPPPKLPCTNCRQKHLKCDSQRPKCGRCEKGKLDCVPVERKTVFRQGTKEKRDESFAGDQVWVSSEARKWRRTGTETKAQTQMQGRREEEELNNAGVVPVVSGAEAARNGGDNLVSHAAGGTGSMTFFSTVLSDPSPPGEYQAVDPLFLPTVHTDLSPSGYPQPVSPLHALVSAPVGDQQSPASVPSGVIDASPHGDNHISPSITNLTNHTIDSNPQPLANIEESCLLRYFIEELSPWFDHCDSHSHFRLTVPLRAQHSPTIRNAIFAVSSRHLSRLPQYRTPQGILYHNQFLPTLSTSSAVEYMLKCIPGLLSFPTIQDPQEQENLMAAAIILRQYEEMEEEMEESEADQDPRVQSVNFLAITQKIITSMISSPLGLDRSSLATAAYWIAIRQEVYYALTRRRVPSVQFTREDWESAEPANIMIMHAGEVAEWCWGGRDGAEYGVYPLHSYQIQSFQETLLTIGIHLERLKQHQQHLSSTYTPHFAPILQNPADVTKAEIFPTVWYTTDAQVTGVQHLELARMILIAEDPVLQTPTTPRSTHRKCESRVRSIVLNICGIALDSPSRMPALVNAVIAILLYGEYFTERREREALAGVVQRLKDMRAWPLRRAFGRIVGEWEGE
ncbi:hypothetical protein BJY04DRAFT_219002 [Aspergillus karnatakaensis]|uniref:uncharacterized protein n=1 Tax=Aspergillus karnatakaensis TaxID=1810916 RepID=UPI003CCCCE0F